MFAPPYRAAVIGRTGHGDYGHDIDTAVRDHPKLDLVAVADDDPKGLASAATKLGVDRTYDDYREMLDREKPQFVAVAPRWIDRHAELIVACAERGIHVFCEKPMAPDLAQCDAIVGACERSHVKLAMAFQTRYSPRFERVRTMIADGAIGEVIELRGRGKEDRRGGGEDLFVLGSHIMDLFRGLLGEASWCFARVTESGLPIGPTQVREGAEGLGLLAGDRVDATYGFATSPAVAHFGTSRPEEPGRRFGLIVAGSKGAIALRTGWLAPMYFLADSDWTGAERGTAWVPISSAGPGQPEPVRARAGMLDANLRILDDLIGAVETDTQPRASVYDGRAVTEMILSCYASQTRGAPVALPLADREAHPLARLSQSGS